MALRGYQRVYAAQFRLSSALAICILIVGCSSGPKLASPVVKLTFNQGPLKLEPDAGVTVALMQATDDPEANFRVYAAESLSREELTFVAKGPERTGIPFGKYRIVVSIKSFDPSEEVEQINRMFSRRATAIVREVTGDETIVLDLSKPEG